MKDIIAHGDNINVLLARYGVKFGIYKNGTFHEQLFPFDPIPRVIPAEDFDYLARGLRQRQLRCSLHGVEKHPVYACGGTLLHALRAAGKKRADRLSLRRCEQ